MTYFGDQGIAQNQGISGIGYSGPDLANNWFHETSLTTNLFNHPDAATVIYHHSTIHPLADLNASSNVIPIGVAINVVDSISCSTNQGGGTVSDPRGRIDSLGLLLDGYWQSFTQLANGGNTAQLEAQILLAGNADYQNLYVDLMGMSPFVEDDQIIELIQNVGFGELALRNIMISNPHAIRNPEVEDALVSRVPAVSYQTYQDIMGGMQTITAMDVLKNQMLNANGEIAQIDKQLKAWYAQDSTSIINDSLGLWLNGRDNYAATLSRVQLKLERSQYSQAVTDILSVDDSKWGAEQIEQMEQIRQVALALSTQDHDSIPLNETTYDALMQLHGNTSSERVKSMIRSMVIAEYDTIAYVEPIMSGATFKQGPEDRMFSESQRTSFFSFYPNPTDDKLSIMWPIQLGGEGDLSGYLVLMDMSGQVISTIDVDLTTGLYVLDCSALPSGNYIFSIFYSDHSLIETNQFQKL